MAAIASTLLALVSQGDHVVISEGLYGKTTTLVARELVRFGVTHDSFDPARPEHAGKTDHVATPGWSWSRPSPTRLLRVADLEAIARVAREAGRALDGRSHLRPAPVPADRAGGDASSCTR